MPEWGMEWTGTCSEPKAQRAIDELRRMPLKRPPSAVTVKPPCRGPPVGVMASTMGSR